MKRIVAGTEEKQTYYVTFQVDTAYVAEVEASSMEEAKQLGTDAFENHCNVGDLQLLGADITLIEDENGDSVYEYEW